LPWYQPALLSIFIDEQVQVADVATLHSGFAVDSGDLAANLVAAERGK